MADSPPSSPRSSSSRAWLWIVAAVAVVVVVAAVLLIWAPWDQPRFEDPKTLALPQQQDAEGMQAWIADQALGGRIQGAMVAVEPLLKDDVKASDCKQIAETGLQSIGKPVELFTAATRAPDHAVGEMATAFLDSTTRYLAACLQGGGASNEELRFTHDVLQRAIARGQ